MLDRDKSYRPHFYRNKGWKAGESILYGIANIWDGLIRILTLGRWGTNWSSNLLFKHLERHTQRSGSFL